MNHNADIPSALVELTKAEQAKVAGGLNPQPRLNPDPVPWMQYLEANPPPVPW
jgi:hypothetical protein